MKTKTVILTSFFAAVLAALFFSCDNPIALGKQLDIEGPIVEFISPVARKAVLPQFTIEGTVSDNSSVSRLLLVIEINNIRYPKQWRYSSGKWEVSADGANWKTLEGAKWNGGAKNASWSIPVDMYTDAGAPQDGEYLFILQAWDIGGFSDDNSYKTRVYIIDNDLPKVDISDPYLFRYSEADLSNPESVLSKLSEIGDDSDKRFDPANIGKFITQSFLLQWQVEDNHDVWSIDLRFYKHDEVIDELEWTSLPDTYIYKFFKNDLVPPEIPEPENNIKPNGTVKIPALDGAAGLYNEGGHLKNPITEKTTIKVVAASYDAAGHANDEKVLGYFIYWPKADEPWIAYSDGMEPFSKYVEADGKTTNINFFDVYMIYPGRKVRANAFHAHGIKQVRYSLYDVYVNEIKDDLINPELVTRTEITVASSPRGEFTNKDIPNAMRPNGSYSTVLAWDFTPPPHTGYFVVKAKAYSNNEESKYYESEEKVSLLKVQDISFPNFPEEPLPIASEPLYMHIKKTNGEDTITISGTVSDATEVTSLTMVWINPESRNYAAMSQLQYLRDQAYKGWEVAAALASGGSTLEKDINNSSLEDTPYPYDESYPNRLWNVPTFNQRLDTDTNRQVYDYSITVKLSDLNIGTGTYSAPSGVGTINNPGTRQQQPLSSQMFLLRAENPDGKTDIITYAPQGDTLSPKLKISSVIINDNVSEPFIPNTYRVIPKFEGGEKITINGTWEEDSAAYINPQVYFLPNLKIEVNTKPLSNITLDQPAAANASGTGNVVGTWKAEITVDAGVISKENLRDTLVVTVSVNDFGGHISEENNAWLIETDNLRFMRISSEATDGTYKAGDTIEFFLEFNKSVVLRNSFNPPSLILNTGAVAAYKPGQSGSNTRHYFEYHIGTNENTARLNVRENPVGINTSVLYTDNINYPFIWERGSGDTLEQIKITNVSTHSGTLENGYYLRQLPVTTSSANQRDYPYTLYAGKNITIDTSPPTAVSVTSITGEGDYSKGEEIYISVKFSEPVQIDEGNVPRLALQVTNNKSPNNYSTAYTNNSSANVRVNGDTITFVYEIIDGDTTNGSSVVVLNNDGNITDLAGNPLPNSGPGSIAALASRTLANRRIDTIPPTTPIVKILSANNINNVVTNTVSGTLHKGDSTEANRALSNLYSETLYLAVQPQDTGRELAKLEYSINGGTDWKEILNPSNASNTIFQITQLGAYNVTARQIDDAGNVSTYSPNVSFTWDKGNIVSRISSTSANGTYTHNAGSINITVYFRKSISIGTPAPTITLNAQNSSNADITLTGSTGNSTNMLEFTYNVSNGDFLPTGEWLNVKSLAINATDGANTSTGVNVSSYIAIPAAGNALRLNENKKITIETGNLVRQSVSFVDGAGDGIRSDDGSYWTTLEIVFNHAINKGSGNITITQIQGSGDTAYRLPTVLTETQYNRFRGIANFSTYYTKGTNGYINGQGADTSTKYVMNYQYNPDSAVTTNNSAFNGDRPIPNTFHDAFRQAERISINVNSQAVDITGSTLKVRLTGSSAPQVPGVTYTVSLPANMVSDNLGNNSSAYSTDIKLGGVAKPYVRIKRTQDTISSTSTPTGASAIPRLRATQPKNAFVRMDSRTPGSIIEYGETIGTYTATNTNWTRAAGPNYTNTTTPASFARPSNTGSNFPTAYPAHLEIGDGNVSGYKWWVRARARTGTAPGPYEYSTYDGEEIAYRTAITYRLQGIGGTAGMIENPSGTTGQVGINTGDQIWVRGGDAISSSSIPGFPFTLEDDWDNLANKRAGIRLMTMRSANTTGWTASAVAANNSTWDFLTWDMNATAYVDFLLGRDENKTLTPPSSSTTTYTASTDDEAWQYGPRWWAYQRAGWTAFKQQYPIYAGEHRWLDVGVDTGGTGVDDTVNFTSAFTSRGARTVNYTNPNTN